MSASACKFAHPEENGTCAVCSRQTSFMLQDGAGQAWSATSAQAHNAAEQLDTIDYNSRGAQTQGACLRDLEFEQALLVLDAYIVECSWRASCRADISTWRLCQGGQTGYGEISGSASSAKSVCASTNHVLFSSQESRPFFPLADTHSQPLSSI